MTAENRRLVGDTPATGHLIKPHVLASLVGDGRLETAVCVGIHSDEGPAAIVDRADLVVEGTAGFVQVLEQLADAAS